MSDTYGFVKNQNLLDEDCKIDDLLDFTAEIELFEKKLQTINDSAVVALVGKFGSGKSTMLHQVQSKSEANRLWINFDAWKYPDRKDLWEGFVIDFADQIGQKKKTVKRIDGESTSSDALDIANNISEKLSLVPGLNIILDLIKKLINTSPAKRVFEIQEVLTKLINCQKKEIYIILEDIDRSGDAGSFFLETLKQFIRSTELKNKIIVIVPISNENYKKNIDSYLKSIDYVHDFNPSNIGLVKFVEEIFVEGLFTGEKHNSRSNRLAWTGEARKDQLISFLERITTIYSNISIRYLKFILRKSNQNYILQSSDGHDPDFRLTICVEFSKHIYPKDASLITYFDMFTRNRRMDKNNIFASFVYAMIENQSSLGEDHNSKSKIRNSPYEVYFTTRKDNSSNPMEEYPSYPWYSGRFADERKLNMCDFYLGY